MSDYFDHMADAWDDRDMRGWDEQYENSWYNDTYSHSSYTPSVETYTKYKFDAIHHQTARAYLFRKGNETVWIPKKLCKNMKYTKKFKIKVHIWDGIVLNFSKISF